MLPDTLTSDETTEEPTRWKLRYRVRDGRALWCVTYDGQNLWQLSLAAKPPTATGGYSRFDALLKLHNINPADLREATI